VSRPGTAKDRVLEVIVEGLRGKYRCHTAILYGSRARGDAGPASDYDVIGIRRRGKDTRWAAVVAGRYVDAFVYSERTVAKPDESFLRMRDGVVLFEKGRVGTRLLERIRRMDARAVAKPDPAEIAVRRVWARKALDRMRRGDAEAHYRRLTLVTQLVEDWFYFRRRRFRGPKEGLATIAAEDPATFALFRRVLRSPRDDARLRALVRRVTAEPASPPRVRSRRPSRGPGRRTSPTPARGRTAPPRSGRRRRAPRR
jgi:predicted nucleotidyltransferase